MCRNVTYLIPPLNLTVAEAQGCPADLSDEQILEKLVALNKERAAE